MYALRKWSVRNAALLERFYDVAEPLLLACHPLWRILGYERLERPIAFVERQVKGLFFDCRMCGQCVLSSTGMACPMNCPKQLRNGPCGGVREDGGCEVDPGLRCVWVEATEGAARMRAGLERIRLVQAPVDSQLQGRSTWLRVARLHGEAHDRSVANAPQ
ncbi:MAG: methylenetetrahydrofolate reductase C-terminal domain-containing protein [Gammaproteobacteria bacterium]|nr:methylenetetrahydrofolate reductase C-terminal domain-containing protein [Gammaproteobacteria bacterium]